MGGPKPIHLEPSIPSGWESTFEEPNAPELNVTARLVKATGNQNLRRGCVAFERSDIQPKTQLTSRK